MSTETPPPAPPSNPPPTPPEKPVGMSADTYLKIIEAMLARHMNDVADASSVLVSTVAYFAEQRAQLSKPLIDALADAEKASEKLIQSLREVQRLLFG